MKPRSTITRWQIPSAKRLRIPNSAANSRMRRCSSLAATLFEGNTWSKLKTVREAFQIGISRLRKASMASGPVTSWAITASTSATTVCRAWRCRPTRRLSISSTSVPISVWILLTCGLGGGAGPAEQEIVHLLVGEGCGVGESLDLGGGSGDLLLVEVEPEARGAVADGVAADQTVADEYLAIQAITLGLEHLVAARIAEHRVAVHPRLVGEGEGAGDGGVEGHSDAEGGGDLGVELGEEVETVGLDPLGRHRADPGDEPGEGGDPVALADTEHGGVDVGGAGLQSGQSVGHRAAGVVVAVELDVAADGGPHRHHHLLDLARGGDADGVGDADPVGSAGVDGPVHGQDLLEVAAEGVLAAEADFAAGAADMADDPAGDVDHLVEGAAVARPAEHVGGGKEDVDAVRAGGERPVHILDGAASVGEHPGPGTGGDRGPQVGLRLGRGRRGGHLDVVDAELVEGGDDLQLLVGGEVGPGELLALAEGRVDDGHALNGHARASPSGRGPTRTPLPSEGRASPRHAGGACDMASSTAAVISPVELVPPRSGVRATASRAASTAVRISAATSGSRSECSKKRATLRMEPTGLAMPRPAMSGAVPWIGS